MQCITFVVHHDSVVVSNWTSPMLTPCYCCCYSNDVMYFSQIEVKKATPREMTARPPRGGGGSYGYRGQ